MEITIARLAGELDDGRRGADAVGHGHGGQCAGVADGAYVLRRQPDGAECGEYYDRGGGNCQWRNGREHGGAGPGQPEWGEFERLGERLCRGR